MPMSAATRWRFRRRCPGTVVAILADDTQHVEAGQVLVKLDGTDADVRLQQARSALAQAVRSVRQQTRHGQRRRGAGGRAPGST